jgi:hypothetical protein
MTANDGPKDLHDLAREMRKLLDRAKRGDADAIAKLHAAGPDLAVALVEAVGHIRNLEMEIEELVERMP